jgi:hypothetical protein
MQPASIFWRSFLDGFTFPGLFGKPERPGTPEYLFAQPEDGEGAVEEPLIHRPAGAVPEQPARRRVNAQDSAVAPDAE